MLLKTEFNKLSPEIQIVLRQTVPQPFFLSLVQQCIDLTKSRFASIDETRSAELIAQDYREIKADLKLYTELQAFLVGLTINPN